jgi:hypothetical protein
MALKIRPSKATGIDRSRARARRAAQRLGVDELDQVDLALIEALLVKPAAKYDELSAACGLAERSILRRVTRPRFADALTMCRLPAVDMLVKGRERAARRLLALVDSADEQVALRACLSILHTLLEPADSGMSDSDRDVFQWLIDGAKVVEQRRALAPGEPIDVTPETTH